MVKQVWRCVWACKKNNPTRIVCEVSCIDSNPMKMCLPDKKACMFFGTDEADFKVFKGPKSLPDGWKA